MIRQRLPLPPGAASCPTTRQVLCARAAECARGTEPHAKGRPVNDFSIETKTAGKCGWFIAITYADGQAAAGPRVHDAPKGLA